jgi:triacylglycerol lipase
MKIVLVHGIMNTGHVMFYIKRQLEKQGFDCYTPTLWPIDGNRGMEHAAQTLKTGIEKRFGPDQNITVIGFRMGGIVARVYLQKLGGANRTAHFFSLAAPHNGCYWAYLPCLGKGIKQLRPNSAFLKSLKADEDSLKGVKLYSYWSPLDTSIVPSSSSFWQIAQNNKFYFVLHPLIIFSPKLAREIVGQLRS